MTQEINNPKEVFDARVGEQRAKMRAVTLRYHKLQDDLTPSLQQFTDRHNTEGLARNFDEIMVIGQHQGTLVTDLLWIEALLDAGIKREVILHIWDLKDENSRRFRSKLEDTH